VTRTELKFIKLGRVHRVAETGGWGNKHFNARRPNGPLCECGEPWRPLCPNLACPAARVVRDILRAEAMSSMAVAQKFCECGASKPRSCDECPANRERQIVTIQNPVRAKQVLKPRGRDLSVLSGTYNENARSTQGGSRGRVPAEDRRTAHKPAAPPPRDRNAERRAQRLRTAVEGAEGDSTLAQAFRRAATKEAV